MHGLLYSAARYRDREHHVDDDADQNDDGEERENWPLAVAVSGTIREIALVVAVIEIAEIEPVDLWLDPMCHPLKSVLEQRTGIRRVLFSPVQSNPNGRSAIQGGCLPVYGSYRDVIQVATESSARHCGRG